MSRGSKARRLRMSRERAAVQALDAARPDVPDYLDPEALAVERATTPGKRAAH